MVQVKRVNITPKGPDFSRVVAGVWKWGDFSAEQTLSLIKESMACGVTTFDHADIYGGYTCEEVFGNALRKEPSLRDNMELVSKCGIRLVHPNRPAHGVKSYDTTKEHIIWSVENSLEKLGTDYLDLLLIHRPDPLMDPDEVAEAFYQLQKAGKVLYFGVSNFTPSQFDLLNSRFPLVTNQVEISVLQRQTLTDGTLDQCVRERVAPMAWSPLGSGKLFTDLDDPTVQRVRTELSAISEVHNGATIDQLLLAWLMKHPANILPILGTGKVERIQAAAAATHIELSREEWFRILKAAAGVDVA